MKRMRRSATQWRELIEQQTNSELSIEAFCHKQGIATSNFYKWRNQLDKPSRGVGSNWVALPTERETCWDIELVLPGDVTLRMKRA